MPSARTGAYGAGTISIIIEEKKLRQSFLFACAVEDTSPRELGTRILREYLIAKGYFTRVANMTERLKE